MDIRGSEPRPARVGRMGRYPSRCPPSVNGALWENTLFSCALAPPHPSGAMVRWDCHVNMVRCPSSCLAISFLLGLLPWKAVCPLIKGWLLSAFSRPGSGCLLPSPWDKTPRNPLNLFFFSPRLFGRQGISQPGTD